MRLRNYDERLAGQCIWLGAPLPTLHSMSISCTCLSVEEALLSGDSCRGTDRGGVFVDVPSKLLDVAFECEDNCAFYCATNSSMFSRTIQGDRLH
jgi:hypothetical protein